MTRSLKYYFNYNQQVVKILLILKELRPFFVSSHCEKYRNLKIVKLLFLSPLINPLTPKISLVILFTVC